MNYLSRFPPLVPRLCSNFLPFFAALSILLVGAGIDLTIGSNALIQSWESRLEDHALIALPPSQQAGSVTPQSPEAQSSDLLQILHANKQITDIKFVSREEITQILSNWGSSWPGPLPIVVRVNYEGERQTLEQNIVSKEPKAIVVFPPAPSQFLHPLTVPLRLANKTITFFLILTGEFVFFLGVILSLHSGWIKHYNSLKILSHLGCSHQNLFRSLMRQFGWRCLLGGYVGVLVLIPFINGITSMLRPILQLPLENTTLYNLFFHNPFSFFWSFVIILSPLLNCLVGWGLTYCSLKLTSHKFL
ncbi:cell division FtsX domain-containing protein [Aristophania vespae]|uniref:hypothetical protein n=1 Tax=Aristophania vespae TaxID=2697033 RepID=UPI0023511D5D|nr:hypothetical protein [Aristophania vespae]UMM63532.1 hypothetical protein DM15PD_05060 [Aristophania vespae]